MKYIYGPVLSRRLGFSLGVDLIPLKTCNWNCVYCQLGRTVPLTNERVDAVPLEDILAEAEIALHDFRSYQVDWITISGSGEPLLYARLGDLIRRLKTLTKIPVALITNGALFYLPEVRQDVLAADVILPSVNAGSADVYRRINRPHPHSGFDRHLDGLVKLRGEYTGKLWVEVMLIKGINDSKEALQDIAAVLQLIRPDEVHLNLPVRAPAETGVEPPDQKGLLLAQSSRRARSCRLPMRQH
jgi:wyosine [tRNA(Phe)-imidazoG37] synthetase (radical SAM superfamily)